jgi:putative OPT family oligopeptide transporter
MASVAKGMFGGELPWDMIAIGGVIGAVIIAFDAWLKSRNSHFRMPVLAAAIGIYLPLELMVPIFLGGLLAHLVERSHGIDHHNEAERDRVHRPGTLFAAGLITGEALMGIFIAIPIVVTANAAVLALPESMVPVGSLGKMMLGIAVLSFVAWLLYRTATRRQAD